MHHIAISTSSFCLWDVGLGEKLTMCKKLGLDRVEVALSTVKMLKDFDWLDNNSLCFYLENALGYDSWLLFQNVL